MEIKYSTNLQEYKQSLRFMEERVNKIIKNDADELLWFLQYPPIYTAGTSAKEQDLLIPNKFPVYQTGRGGEYTYHGPGQRIIYVMLDLTKRNSKDIKKFIFNLEQWVINSLQIIGVKGERREGRTGIWITNGAKEEKISAIGIRLRRWVTFHGVSINLNPNLANFDGIVPCGISNYGVTSLEKLGINISVDKLDDILQHEFLKIFEDY